jgi:hypothetical protein
VIYLVVLLVLLLAAAAFVWLTFALGRAIDHAQDDPCAMWCQYSRDVAMDPYYSCAHGCIYLQMGRR